MIEIEELYGETLFFLLWGNIQDACGDGCGAIVCNNPEETAQWFIEWIRSKAHPHEIFKDFPKPPHKIDLSHGYVNIHDSNENIIFTSNPDIKLSRDDFDIKFIVRGNIDFKFWPDRVIRRIVEYSDE